MKMSMLAVALVVGLSACAGVAGDSLSPVSKLRYAVAMKAEELRCTRSMGLVMQMGDALGDAWFTGLVGNCPNMQAFIKRAMEKFKLVPLGE